VNASQVPSAGTSRGLVAAALALPSAIREEQISAECVDVTKKLLKQLMETFATWCPCSAPYQISVLLYGIIYRSHPLIVVEAWKCLELVVSSIKTMGIIGPKWFKACNPAYKTLKDMRNAAAHATWGLEPAPNYNKVISLLATVLNSYHEHYFVSQFGWWVRPFHNRQCHDPNCPKREKCLKRQQEYLRSSASCVEAIVEEQHIEQIIRDFYQEDGKSLDEVCREAGDEVRVTHQPGVCYAHDGKEKDFCSGCASPDCCPDCSGPDSMDFNGKTGKTNWMFMFGRKRWELLYGWRLNIPQEEVPGRWDELVKEYDEQQRNEKLAESLKAAHLLYNQGQDPLFFRERTIVEDHLVELLNRIEVCTCKKDMDELVEPLDLILKAEIIMRRSNTVKLRLANAWKDQLSRVAV
jgi:hypothetical protein